MLEVQMFSTLAGLRLANSWQFVVQFRESVDTCFLSPIDVGLLPASFAGLGGIFFGVGRFAAARKAAASQAAIDDTREVWQPAVVKQNWYWSSKRIFLFQRARKWTIQKFRGLKDLQNCGLFSSLQRRDCD